MPTIEQFVDTWAFGDSGLWRRALLRAREASRDDWWPREEESTQEHALRMIALISYAMAVADDIAPEGQANESLKAWYLEHGETGIAAALEQAGHELGELPVSSMFVHEGRLLQRSRPWIAEPDEVADPVAHTWQRMCFINNEPLDSTVDIDDSTVDPGPGIRSATLRTFRLLGHDFSTNELVALSDQMQAEGKRLDLTGRGPRHPAHEL